MRANGQLGQIKVKALKPMVNEKDEILLGGLNEYFSLSFHKPPSLEHSINHQVGDLSLFLSSLFSLKGLNFDHWGCGKKGVVRINRWRR
jgi:hypothetical protein